MTMSPAECYQALQVGHDPYAGHRDTGWFGSKIAHAVSNAVSSVAKDAGKGVSTLGKGIVKVADAPLNLTGKYIPGVKYLNAPAKFVGHMGVDAAEGVAQGAINTVAHPNLNNLVATAQNGLKNLGPVGMVASGAMGAMKAGLQGKNLESIAWAAAEGAAPSGIDKAIAAAEALRHGSNVLKTALNSGLTSFLPGTPEALGFNAAVAVLKTAANKGALGVARAALNTEGARRAFDAAIGTVSKVAQANPAALIKRVGIPNISMGKAKGVISPYQPNLKNAIDTLKRNPALMTQHPMVLAAQFGTTQQTVLDAIRRVGTESLLPWRSLTPTAAMFVRKWHPSAPMSALTHGTADTAGLDQTGTKYIVVSGDSPWSIAQKLSGNGANWTQLKALNMDKNPTIDKNVCSGEVLNIPASWQKPVAAPAAPPPVALPTQPAPQAPSGPVTPVLPPAISVAPSILQAKSILVAWSKTDGLNQAGLSDYGTNVADLSTSMGPRDNLELQAFQNWDNKSSSAGLPVNGQLDAATLTALQNWAEARAAQAIPNASLPGQVILPTVISQPDVPNPTVQPASPVPTVTPKGQTAPATGSKLPVMAGGAAVGGLLFGLPGAILGGIAGAAIG